jgi:hypothetical protein
MGILLYIILIKREITPKKPFFWFGMITLVMFVGSSVSNQLISSFTCRPVEMMYDRRYASMIGTQIFVFIASLHFAYGFGQTCGPILNQRKISQISKIYTQTKLDDRGPSLSRQCHIP